MVVLGRLLALALPAGGAAVLAVAACGQVAGTRTNVQGEWDGSPENAGSATVTGSVNGQSVPQFTGAIWVGVPLSEAGTEVVYLFSQPVACGTLVLASDGGSWSNNLVAGTPFIELKAKAAQAGVYGLYPHAYAMTANLAKVEYITAGSTASTQQALCGTVELCAESGCVYEAGLCDGPLDPNAPTPPIFEDAGPLGGEGGPTAGSHLPGHFVAYFGGSDALTATFDAIYCPQAHELP